MKNIKGFYHFGIAVHDIDEVKSLFVNVLNLELVQEREIKGPYVDSLVGAVNSSALVNFFRISNEEFIETLYWDGGKIHSESSLKSSIKNVGTTHICLYVEDIEDIYNKIKNFNNDCLVSDSIVEISTGPNQGSRVFFAKFFSYLFIEFFQRHNS
jgi:catechol 2,3-dioxygenase-like lactoylglutathione lyase family enzyme